MRREARGTIAEVLSHLSCSCCYVEVGNGFITPDRTHLISSTARAYLMPEKMAMADGRIDDERLRNILNKAARKSILFDANKLSKDAGAIVNSVMLGAIAASDVIGIELEDFIQAIKSEGKAVDSNIAGCLFNFNFLKHLNFFPFSLSV